MDEVIMAIKYKIDPKQSVTRGITDADKHRFIFTFGFVEVFLPPGYIVSGK
ncbi:hypothetical protein M3584_14715 [Bacillus safensis]|nr:hypothetical protein [Bacillus safensis]MCM3028120.1 hypothetical protein [Bacillus safensis]